jgi:hypothetical protein
MHPTSRTAAGGRRRHLPTFSLLLPAAVAACLGLAACGGSSSGNPGGESSVRQAAEQQAVKFAKCMREHGVDAETTKGPDGHGFGLKISGGGPPAGGPGAGHLKAGPPPQIARAMNACKQYRPQPKQLNLSPAEKAAQAKKALEFARCMRSHGIDVSDPGSSGVVELNNVNPQSATFEAAQRACRSLMGKLPLAVRVQAPGGAGGSGELRAGSAGGSEK